jgi:citrate lyase subunit beta/citryl-CoA lyase
MVAQIDDLGLVRRVAARAKRMGGTGAMAIHPSHVPILNEVYGPAGEEIARARETIVAMAEAVARGDAAVRLRGAMVDHAHVAAARELLDRARSMGIDVGDVPRVPGPATG